MQKQGGGLDLQLEEGLRERVRQRVSFARDALPDLIFSYGNDSSSFQDLGDLEGTKGPIRRPYPPNMETSEAQVGFPPPLRTSSLTFAVSG